LIRSQFPEARRSVVKRSDSQAVSLPDVCFACGWPEWPVVLAAAAIVGKIMPYVRQPEGMKRLANRKFYATAMDRGGVATGLLVKATKDDRRRSKANPNHPASLGATDVFAQADVARVVRSRSIAIDHLFGPAAWLVVRAVGAPQSTRSDSQNKWAGLRILTETISSPTLAAIS